MASAEASSSKASMSSDTPSASTTTAPIPTTAARATQERDRKRAALRASNLETWAQGPSPPSGALDSSLKKNTAFVKRIKQSLGADQKDAALKDIVTLNLDKYIEEIVQSIPEGLSKCTSAKDCLAAAEVLSALHKRFGPAAFAAPLTEQLASILSPPSKAVLQSISAEQRERDESARVQRQKGFLRVAAELALVQLLGPVEKHRSATASLDWLFSIIKDLLANDREHVNIPMLVTLLKALGSTLLTITDEPGPTPAELNTAPAAGQLPEVVPKEYKIKLQKLFETYFETLKRRVVREHTRLQDQDRRNHEAYIKSGEIFEDRQQSFEKTTKNFEKLTESARQLAELLDLPMPKLADSVQSSGIGLNLDAKSAFERDDEDYTSGKLPWEDEDTRRFYEDLPDLRDLVPMDLLQAGANPVLNAKLSRTGWNEAPAGEQAASAEGESKADEATATAPDAEDGDDGSSTPRAVLSPPGSPLISGADLAGEAADAGTSATSADPASSAEDASSTSSKINVLLLRLPELTSRDAIDNAAAEFGFLNSKAARGRLIRSLSTIPKHRSDLAPYYARFIALLNKYMPDVGGTVCAWLDDEFRYIHKKKFGELSEKRARNAQFLGELTKFKVTPIHVVFHCLKVCLDDFSAFCIETISILLETCGRFLLRTEQTSERMKNTLELLRRKRAATHIDQRYLLLLDNAYYFCNPPERKAVEQKKRTPMELYIRQLFYDVLAKRTLEKVLKLVRKLHWEVPAVRKTLFKAFTKPWRIKFGNVHLLAILLFELQTYHADFVIEVLEQICEEIVNGLESNVFQYSQRRVTVLRYLGELFNYRLINSKLLFDQLWILTTFGHPNGRPLPGQFTPLDPPDDCFRVRLICTLLDTCGPCFDRGSLKKRLDSFMTFFNLYVLSKTQPLPMEIEYMLTDTLEIIRPGLKFKTTFEEAAVAVDQMFALQRTQPAVDDGADEESDDSGEDEEEDEGETRGEEGDEDDDEDAGSDSTVGEDDQPDLKAQDGVDEEAMEREREVAESVRRADEEFDRELAKLIAESNPSSSATSGQLNKQRKLLDAGLPFLQKASSTPFGRSAAVSGSGSGGGGSSEESQPEQEGHMKFSLLSKKGSKPTTTEVQVPLSAAIAIQTRTKQLQDEAERKHLKELVLAYGLREQHEEQQQQSHQQQAGFAHNNNHHHYHHHARQ